MDIVDNAPKGDVGIIVGRFQTDVLHEGHIDLINAVKERHGRLIIFLGLSPLPCTKNNPLDFQARKQLIIEHFGNEIDVLYVKDQHCNKVWVQKLDEQIKDQVGVKSAVLYGSRDSFKPSYEDGGGSYPVIELESSSNISGKEIRDRIKGSTLPDRKFRSGVIHATQSQYDVCYPCVDIAIINYDGLGRASDLLLGRKPNETLWRFPGGFAEPDSDSYELDAKREAAEETSIEVGEIKYIGSKRINDWRYRSERSKIKTSFFKAVSVFGNAQAGDDLAEVKWFKLDGFNIELLNDSHKELYKMLEQNLGA